MDFSNSIMENSNLPITHPTSMASQGYQVQPAMWNGNKVCSTNFNQNANTAHYSPQRNNFYQAPYSTPSSSEMNRYLSPASKDSTVNNSQYPVARQTNFPCPSPSPNYKNNLYYKGYPVTSKYDNSSYGFHSTGTVNKNHNVDQNLYINAQENQSFLMRQAAQVSSIPTPPESSVLPADITSPDAFALPGSSINPISNRTLQPPTNLDEGSQASSASASSSLPDEQNSAKTKPNFSYPPTPNTLSSPGAASMSSFHDDLECISSPGWPKTPASPVANSNYEFANIKRPENLLKLYTLSDEPDRRYFLDKLIVFNEERGSPITQCPTISKQPLDVFRVYLTVKERGGFVEVTNAKRWKDIAGAIGVGASSSAAYTLRKQYMKLLLPFECKYDRGGIDPQPIINMVEASSRKKGKNTTSAYGCFNQGYSQVHPSYSSYQSSRYPCNSMDYSQPVQYQQSVSHSAHPTGQSQYHQYSQNSVSNYGYYQGNNSTNSHLYNNNVQNSTCRYGSNSSLSSVPHQPEQVYYAQQYSSQQVQENSYVSNNLIPPVCNQVSNEASYSNVSSAVNGASESNISLHKVTPDSHLNMNTSCSASDFESCLGNKSYCSSYSVTNQTSVPNASCTPSPNISQAYQQSVSENTINKMHDNLNYYNSSPGSVNLYSNPSQSSYRNPNCFPNQKFHYQAKKQIESDQFGQYPEGSNESYRPPSRQGDQKNMSSRENTKMFSYNSSIQKNTGYDSSIQKNAGYDSSIQKNVGYNSSIQKTAAYNSSIGQGDNKNESAYSNYLNTGPPKAWNGNQSPSYQGCVSNQRVAVKSPSNSAAKLNSESPSVQKNWPVPQESESNSNKPPNTLSTTSPTQIAPVTKSQCSPQAFQSMMKRPLEFPPDSVESVKVVAAKRRRCPAKKLGSIDPWRLMLALKSGLLAECTWALDTLSILLADNSTVVYFALTHLPGLLNVLVDHYRCFLNKIFQLANDVEIKCIKYEDDYSYLSLNEISDVENKVKVLNTPNYTYKTRCKKKVEIQYDEALFLIDPQRSWDKYEGFNVSLEHWQKGGGDITSHIQTTFDNCSNKLKFYQELYTEGRVKQKLSKITVEGKSVKPVLNEMKSSLLHRGEPVVVLQKFNFLANKISISDTEQSENSAIKSNESIKKDDFMDSCESGKLISDDSSDMNDPKIESRSVLETSDRLRGSASSRKRFLCEDLEDESYCFDEPALFVMSDSQEMLSRRCVCVSTILRNLSFVPGNDLIMGKNSGVLLLLGRLLLLHHEHKPTKKAYRKYEKENQSWDESCISLKDDPEWWWGTLSVLRDNTLVILSNISGQLDLAPFPEEISLPILDGLLHWIVCPSSYAQDPLPSRFPSSVLSPQRLSLEALCKLSVLSSNVDLIIATPPWSRIENLFAFLTKSLCHGQDAIMREFALILLSNLSEADSTAARTIAEQSHSISYLIAFIEEAEANAFQIALSEGPKKLHDQPELMGTTPGMVKRAASTLKNLALVPENQGLFGRHQARLLSLVMSQVMDQELATVIAEILFYSSQDQNS